MGSNGQGRPGAPLPESLSQPSALVPSHPEVPRGSGEGSGPTSPSPPGQASASLCPACGKGTALASLLFPSSTFQAQVPRAEPPQHPSHGVCPCCPGFSLQIVPLPLAVPPLSVKAYLSSAPSSGAGLGSHVHVTSLTPPSRSVRRTVIAALLLWRWTGVLEDSLRVVGLWDTRGGVWAHGILTANPQACLQLVE